MRATQYRKFLFLLLFVVIGLVAKSKITKQTGKAIDDAPENVETTYVKENQNETEPHYVCPCGYPIGIYVKTEGVMVINTGSFKSIDGSVQSPCEGVLKQGDYILSINGEKLADKKDMMNIVSNCQGSDLDVYIVRNGERLNVRLTPKQNEDGIYMLGLWIKDDISGIGTLTYIDENGFAALGHSINDNDTGERFIISEGAIYETQLLRIVKSDGEHAGRIEGMINYQKPFMLGKVTENESNGIKGTLTKLGTKRLETDNWMQTATAEQVHTGSAKILSWISGEPEYYDIEITHIYAEENSDNQGKNLEIKITDTKLLDMTSGIVQGLSGTPIIQDGKLAGAITHVLVNDPTRGYGIFIENMLKD